MIFVLFSYIFFIELSLVSVSFQSGVAHFRLGLDLIWGFLLFGCTWKTSQVTLLPQLAPFDTEQQRLNSKLLTLSLW